MLPLSPQAQAAVEALRRREQNHRGRQALHRLQAHRARARRLQQLRDDVAAEPVTAADRVHHHLTTTGRPATQTMLARALGIPASTAGTAIQRLHAQGRVTRHPGGRWAAAREDAA